MYYIYVIVTIIIENTSVESRLSKLIGTTLNSAKVQRIEIKKSILLCIYIK